MLPKRAAIVPGHGVIPCRANSPPHNEAGRHASGRAGILPAAFRILRNAPGHPRRSEPRCTSAGCRAECPARRVENPPYPKPAVLIGGRIFVRDGMIRFLQQGRPVARSAGTQVAVGEAWRNPRKEGKRKAPRRRRNHSRLTVSRTASAVHGWLRGFVGCVATLLAHGYHCRWRYAPFVSSRAILEVEISADCADGMRARCWALSREYWALFLSWLHGLMAS